MRSGPVTVCGARLGKRGFTLIELLIALVLGAVLLGSALVLMASLSRAVDTGLARWDRLEALRTVWVTLERELRPGRPGRDWRVTAEGAVELRAFRGFARVCGPAAEPGIYRVAWRGERAPVPDRDSVLVLGRDGGWREAALTYWSEAGDCPVVEEEQPGRMSWSGAGSEPPVLIRLFQRGAYSVNDGAFRYRAGVAGRQPLTPELFASESGFSLEPSGVGVVLNFEPVTGGSSGGEGVRFTIHLDGAAEGAGEEGGPWP
jgi:prepilin-type N-terminal cleavage/methylation domain-containing protein